MPNPFPFTSGQVLTAAQMNGIGEAAIDYTPVVTAGAGTITSYTAFGGYQIVNKIMRVWFNINITNNGTATSFIRFTLPTAQVLKTYGQVVGGCRESSVNGFFNQCWTETTTTIAITSPTNTYPAGTGFQLNGTVLVQIP
jgi:hypothetical protein